MFLLWKSCTVSSITILFSNFSGKFLTAVWSYFVLFLLLIYQSDFRTSLLITRYTPSIDSDADAIASGKPIYLLLDETRVTTTPMS